MIFEIKKICKAPVIWCLIVILLSINWILISNVCKKNHDYVISTKEWQHNYEKIIVKANKNINNGVDVEYNKNIIATFAKRVPNKSAFFTNEVDYIQFSKTAIWVMIIAIMVGLRLMDDERTSKTAAIVSVSEKRIFRIYLPKMLALATFSTGVLLLFYFQEYMLFKILGAVDRQLSVYHIPGYFYTRFDGTIAQYKIMYAIAVGFIAVFLGALAYLAILFTKNVVIAVTGITLAGAMIYIKILDEITYQYRFYDAYSPKLPAIIIISGIAAVIIMCVNCFASDKKGIV